MKTRKRVHLSTFFSLLRFSRNFKIMSLTCLACRVLFSLPDLQREHYKSDWHRYNLKRKIAELPPVTKEEFDVKAASYSQATSQSADVFSCDLCGKKFVSKNSMVNHLQSKKHLEMQSKRGESGPDPRSMGQKSELNDLNKPKMASEDGDGEEEEEEIEDDGDDEGWESCDDEDMDDTSIPPNTCLFCNTVSPTLEDNIKHMTVEHSFFIPDIEYLCDLNGLITYLGHKVGNGYMCLWCCKSGKSFRSAKSAQQHMLDKGHCKMLHEGEALMSYSPFYDYSSSHPDAAEGNTDEEIPLDLLDSENFELVLPSGAIIGHRSLAIYYKQNLKPQPTENKKSIGSIVQHYKSLGWTGTSGMTAVQKAKDLSYMRKVQNRMSLKLAMKKNKMQPHFRPQVMF